MKLLNILILIVSLQLIGSAKVVNIDDITNQAKKQDKQIVIFFHMTHCGFCKKMIKTSLNDPKIAKQIEKNFILLSLNINYNDTIIYKDFKGSIHAFARSLNINLYPSTIFISEDNEVIFNLVGYRGKGNFLNAIEYISSGVYKKMSLEYFIDDKEFNE